MKSNLISIKKDLKRLMMGPYSAAELFYRIWPVKNIQEAITGGGKMIIDIISGWKKVSCVNQPA